MRAKNILSVLMMTTMLALTSAPLVYGLGCYFRDSNGAGQLDAKVILSARGGLYEGGINAKHTGGR